MTERREGTWQAERDPTETTRLLLAGMLAVTVPLWIERMRRWPEESIFARAHECAQIVAEKGDVILYRGKKGESAAAFNALAEGVAVLAFAPGGVTIFGLHFEAARD